MVNEKETRNDWHLFSIQGKREQKSLEEKKEKKKKNKNLLSNLRNKCFHSTPYCHLEPFATFTTIKLLSYFKVLYSRK